MSRFGIWCLVAAVGVACALVGIAAWNAVAIGTYFSGVALFAHWLEETK